MSVVPGYASKLNVDPTTGDLLVVIAPKTILSAVFSTNSNTALVAAVAGKRVKVVAVAFTTGSTSAVSPLFTDGNGGTTLWEIGLQAITGSVSGVSQAVAPPGWLFGTSAGNALYINPEGATTTGTVSYFTDDAT